MNAIFIAALIAAAPGARTIDMSVTTNGFEPSKIEVKKGEPVHLVVTRKTDATCATEVVIKDLGIDPAVPNGYDNLRYTVRIKGDGTKEQFAEIHQAVMATSPNFYNMTRPVTLNPVMVVE